MARRGPGWRRRQSVAVAVAGAIFLGFGLTPSVGQAASRSMAAGAPLQLHARVLGHFPHDRAASTQGLEWIGGKLYESTGLWGESSLRRVDLETGNVEQRVDLDANLFGEGLARVGPFLWQLTWQSGRAFRYDLESLRRVGESVYRGQGWGLCFDGVDLWRSDGSDRLHRHDPETFAELDSIEVSAGGRPVTSLNELECAEGWIYANVWQRDVIVRIDPASGAVMAVIDASGLLSQQERGDAGVLNGIAYREESGTFLLTGKKWPRIFEVVFVENRF